MDDIGVFKEQSSEQRCNNARYRRVKSEGQLVRVYDKRSVLLKLDTSSLDITCPERFDQSSGDTLYVALYGL